MRIEYPLAIGQMLVMLVMLALGCGGRLGGSSEHSGIGTANDSASGTLGGTHSGAIPIGGAAAFDSAGGRSSEAVASALASGGRSSHAAVGGASANGGRSTAIAPGGHTGKMAAGGASGGSGATPAGGTTGIAGTPSSSGTPGAVAVVGRYELKLGESAPWEISGYACPDLRATSPVPMTFGLVDSPKGLKGWLAAEWELQTDMTLVEVRNGVLHAELISWRKQSVLGVNVEESVVELNLPLDAQGKLVPGTARLARRCSIPNDPTEYQQTIDVSATPSPDHTAPRFRVLDEYSLDDVAHPVTAWTTLSLEASEPLELDYREFPLYVTLSTAGIVTPTAISWDGCDSEFHNCYAHFVDPDEVSDTEQRLMLEQPLRDAAGNTSPSGTVLQSFRVTDVGPSHTSLEFDSADFLFWGEAKVRPAGDPLCESGGCLVLGPALTYACPRSSTVSTGFSVRLRNLEHRAVQMKMRARFQQSLRWPLGGWWIEYSASGGWWAAESFEEALPGGKTLSPLPAPDGEILYTTDWGTIAESFSADDLELLVKVSLPEWECDPNHAPTWLRVIVDRVWLE